LWRRCPCGQHYCYQCGATLDPKRPYDHFAEGKPCQQNMDTEKFNAKKVEEAGKRTLAELQAEQGGQVNLRHNPLGEAAAAAPRHKKPRHDTGGRAGRGGRGGGYMTVARRTRGARRA
jgi:hypothetical protein